MIKKNLLFKAPNGLHARPAGELVKTVKSFEGTTVTLSTAAKSVKASGILSVLSLGVKAGTELEITANGDREQEALDAVVSILESISE